MGSGRGYHTTSIFTVLVVVLKRFILSEFDYYSYSGLGVVFSPRTRLTTATPCVKLWFLIKCLVLAIYRFYYSFKFFS